MVMKTTRKQGFTMVEMLAVIVIIGILAASLFGPVTGAILKGNLQGMQGNGRKIVQAIISADMNGLYAGVAWPASENKDNASEDKPTGPDMYQDFSTTAKYFEEALYMKETDVVKRNRLKVLQDIEPSALIADGMPVATGSTINDNNCGWALAKNTSEAPAKAPVLVSRNMNVTQLINLTGNDTSSDVDTILNSQKPFQKKGCVILYKDGSGKTFAAQDVYPKNLFGDIGDGKLSSFEQGDGNKFEFLTSGSSK